MLNLKGPSLMYIIHKLNKSSRKNNHLNKNFALLFFKFANLSTTELLKLIDSLISLISIESIVKALSLSSNIVFLKNFFCLFLG